MKQVNPVGWKVNSLLDWFKLVFLEFVKKQYGPKILFLDGHASHISLDLIELARVNDVILFRLPAHTSHLLQPLVLGVFKIAKAVWRSIIQNFFISEGFKAINKPIFPRLMNILLKKMDSQSKMRLMALKKVAYFLYVEKK